MEEFVITVPVEYRRNGWSVHSGAGRRHDRWHLTLYIMGEQVATYPRTFPNNKLAEAQARAASLNSKCWSVA